MSSFNLSTEVEITVPLYSGRTHGLVRKNQKKSICLM